MEWRLIIFNHFKLTNLVTRLSLSGDYCVQ